MGALSVTAEVVTAGTALAGLLLVYVGNQVASYGSYSATEKRTVKTRFQVRVALAGVGIVVALLAAFIALLSKVSSHQNWAEIAVFLAALSFLWTIVVAAANVWEMK